MIPETEISGSKWVKSELRVQNDHPFDESCTMEGKDQYVSQGFISSSVVESRDDSFQSLSMHNGASLSIELCQSDNDANDLRVWEPRYIKMSAKEIEETPDVRDSSLSYSDANRLTDEENCRSAEFRPQSWHAPGNKYCGTLDDSLLIPNSGPKEYKREEIFNDLASLFISPIEEPEMIPNSGPKEYKREEIFKDLADLFITPIEEPEMNQRKERSLCNDEHFEKLNTFDEIPCKEESPFDEINEHKVRKSPLRSFEEIKVSQPLRLDDVNKEVNEQSTVYNISKYECTTPPRCSSFEEIKVSLSLPFDESPKERASIFEIEKYECKTPPRCSSYEETSVSMPLPFDESSKEVDECAAMRKVTQNDFETPLQLELNVSLSLPVDEFPEEGSERSTVTTANEMREDRMEPNGNSKATFTARVRESGIADRKPGREIVEEKNLVEKINESNFTQTTRESKTVDRMPEIGLTENMPEVIKQSDESDKVYEGENAPDISNGDEGTQMNYSNGEEVVTQNTGQMASEKEEIIHDPNEVLRTSNKFSSDPQRNKELTHSEEQKGDVVSPNDYSKFRFHKFDKYARPSDGSLETVEENEEEDKDELILTEERPSVREITKEFIAMEPSPQGVNRKDGKATKHSTPDDILSKVLCVQTTPQATANGVTPVPLHNSKSTILHEIGLREDWKQKKISFLGITEGKSKSHTDLLSDTGKFSDLPNAAMQALKAGANDDIFSKAGLVANMRPQDKKNDRLVFQPGSFNTSMQNSLVPTTTVLRKNARHNSLIPRSLDRIVTKVGTKIMESTVVDETVGFVEDVVWAFGNDSYSCCDSESATYYSDSAYSQARSRAASTYAQSYTQSSVQSQTKSSYVAPNSRAEALLMERKVLEKAILDLRAEKARLEERALENAVKGLRSEKTMLEKSVVESANLNTQKSLRQRKPPDADLKKKEKAILDLRAEKARLEKGASENAFRSKKTMLKKSVVDSTNLNTQKSIRQRKLHDTDPKLNKKMVSRDKSANSDSIQSDHYDKKTKKIENSLVPSGNFDKESEEQEYQKTNSPAFSLNPMLETLGDSIRSVSEGLQSRMNELIQLAEDRRERQSRDQKAIVLHDFHLSTKNDESGSNKVFVPFEY